jgi:hypothetical protein
MGRACSLHGREGQCIVGLVEKLEGKRPVGRSRCSLQGDIKMDLKEIEWDFIDWINLAQDRDEWPALVNMVKKLQVP